MAALAPTHRLRGKTTVKFQGHGGSGSKVQRSKVQRSKLQKTCKAKLKAQISRAEAVKEGLIPKARRAFALFTQEQSSVATGSSREAFAAELKELGRKWSALPEAEKAIYKARSAAEFQAQREKMVRCGMFVRGSLEPRDKLHEDNNDKRDCDQDQSLKNLKIGPYTIAMPEQTGSDSVLGNGSYGKVFTAFCSGRACALKVFRSRHAEEEAGHEVSQYKMLEKLPASYRQWFPELLSSDAAGVPFPWMSTSLCGKSLADWIEVSGPLPREMLQPFVSQLQTSIRTLHCQAGLLRLDIKPGNVLWRMELKQLRLCDLGMVEPLVSQKPSVESSQAQLRFNQYCTPLYRPPELWCVKDDASLRKALTAAVDLWSFGCTAFEAASGMQLMKPTDARQSAQKRVASWCQDWQQLTATTHKNLRSVWAARLSRCDFLRPVVLSACHPEPTKRRWTWEKRS